MLLLFNKTSFCNWSSINTQIDTRNLKLHLCTERLKLLIHHKTTTSLSVVSMGGGFSKFVYVAVNWFFHKFQFLSRMRLYLKQEMLHKTRTPPASHWPRTRPRTVRSSRTSKHSELGYFFMFGSVVMRLCSKSAQAIERVSYTATFDSAQSL